ncbi:MAG: hypothetical protein ACRDNS_32420 [Trebonia sp.]
MSHTSPATDQPRVRDAADHVEITGLSRDDVLRALELWSAAGGRQARARELLLGQLTQAMLDADVPAVPEATGRQVQRTAALCERLLRGGYDTYASLAAKRDTKESSVRTWVTRLRHKNKLFTVKRAGQTIIPAIQLTGGGGLRPEIESLTTPLLQAGLDEWSVWAWLASPTDRLSGEVPATVAATNPQRARRAALRYASQITHATTPAA